MAEAPIVTVTEGQLQGKAVASPSGKIFYSFQGIPYAKPPLGSLRFKAPQPAESWEGIRDATSEGNVCAQIDIVTHKEYIGDENCLFLNVYTPNLDGEFLPVMIWIHGGGFLCGSGNTSLYGADYLVEKDVVVVTLNYRCGALGFLGLNTPEVPGNAGLKDVVQAIRWVKENIHNFGGNSGNITLFGESAGGVAVSLLTASPLTKNLINKAIIQSGTALSYGSYQKNPIENAKELAKQLGCEMNDVDELLDFLATTPVRDLVEANAKLAPKSPIEKTLGVYAPVIEKEFPEVESVINEALIDLVTTGRIADIPIIIGSTTLEFASAVNQDDLQLVIPEDLKIERNTEEALQVVEKIKKAYFKGSHTGVESLNEYFELISDKLVNVDTHRYVQYMVQVSNKPIYYYKFDYVGELNISKKLITSLGLKHAGHMDELGYLFKNDFQKDVEATAQDIKMRERMLRLWTNFAKSGNPTPDENHYLTVTWQPVTKDNLYYLNLGSELSLGTNPDKEKMDMWDSLYQKHFKLWMHPKVNNDEAPRKAIATPEAETTIEAVETKTTEAVETETTEAVETTTTASDVTEADAHIPEVVETAATPVLEVVETETTVSEVIETEPEVVEVARTEVVNNIVESRKENGYAAPYVNGNGVEKPTREIKTVHPSNGTSKDVIRANDPPEDDLPKNIGVNKFVNFFESLGGKK